MKAGRILLPVLLLVLTAGPLRAEIVSRIAAVVNADVITTHQLDQAVAAVLEGKPKPSPVDLANLRSQLLNRMIEDKLVQQKIAELKLTVSDEELEAAIRDVQKQNHLTREQLVAALQAQGMSFDAYKENMRKQILRFKLIGREVRSKVEVTNQDLLDYFREHIDDYREAPYTRISRITFPVPASADAAAKEKLKADAEAARKRLEAGDALDQVLKDYAAAGAEGGDMGTFKEGELAPVFDRAIRDLKQGQVSAVVAGPRGNFYLFKVDVRKPGTIHKFDTVKDEIEQTLLKQKREERFQEWAKSLRKDAYIDIRI